LPFVTFVFIFCFVYFITFYICIGVLLLVNVTVTPEFGCSAFYK